MKATVNNFSFPKAPKKRWSIEKKMTIGAILTILAGFITFGAVLEKISQLNSYMQNTNDLREEVAGLKSTTNAIVTDVSDVKKSVGRIEDYILQVKNETHNPKR